MIDPVVTILLTARDDSPWLQSLVNADDGLLRLAGIEYRLKVVDIHVSPAPGVVEIQLSVRVQGNPVRIS
jgi:hypothetical protein